VTRRNAVADNQGKQVRAENTEHAPDCGPNQPGQTDGAQLPLKQDDGEADARAYTGIKLRREPKRTDEVTSYANNNNEQKTNRE